MKERSAQNSNITDIIAPMVAITMELDSIISALLREKFSLSLADFKVLRVVFMLSECTQLDIARFNHVTEAAVSKRIKSMEKEGLIRKRVSAEDKRKSVLSLTTKGRGNMKKIQTTVMQSTESTLTDFSQTNRKLTKVLLVEILGMIIEQSPNRDMLRKSKHPMMGMVKNCEVNKK